MVLSPKEAKESKIPKGRAKVRGEARVVVRGVTKAKAREPPRMEILNPEIPHRRETRQGPPQAPSPPSQPGPNRGARVPGRGKTGIHG